MSEVREIRPWQVWWAAFDPQIGREQAGERPAIVVGTRLACALPNGLVVVVPCTTTLRGFDIHPVVQLGQPSAAMCDQVKSISRRRLIRRHPARLTVDEIGEIKFVLRQLVEVA